MSEKRSFESWVSEQEEARRSESKRRKEQRKRMRSEKIDEKEHKGLEQKRGEIKNEKERVSGGETEGKVKG